MVATRAPGVLFAADVHWQASETETDRSSGLFGNFLQQVARRAGQGEVRTLYILGDLFDFWHESRGRTLDSYEPHLAALRRAVEEGLTVRLLFGNRDFSYGKAIQRVSGVEIVGDRAELQLNGRRILLHHGDLFCTRDRRYLIYRRLIRSAPARAILGLVPLCLAASIARRMTGASAAEVARKGERVTSIVEQAVLAEHAKGFEVVICGHVHRAGRWRVPGAPEGAELIVLGAWDAGSGSYLEFDGRTFALKSFAGPSGTAQSTA